MPLIDANEAHDAVVDLLSRRTPFPEPVRSGSDGSPLGAGPAEGGRPLAEIVAERRSVRRFADRPVAKAVLADVLDLAERQQRDQWPEESHGSPELTTLVAAHALAGVEPGLYLRDPVSRQLDRVASVDSVDTLRAAYAPAPVLALICGPVRSMPGASYGNLLVRAGALGQSIWLAGLTHDLCCSVYGGTSEAVGRLSGRARAHLFTVALGHPDRTEPR